MSNPATRRSFDRDTPDEAGGVCDESKRKSRNLSEKKRRDQFNNLIHELCSMVSTSSRKVDKSTVLQMAIRQIHVLSLRNADLAVQSQVHESPENWKPSFLSNDEFTHLMLEGLDGFIMVISSDGTILFVSESVTQRLGHLPGDLVNRTIFEVTPPEDRSIIHELLMGPLNDYTREHSAVINFRIGGLEMHQLNYQRVRFCGHFKRWNSTNLESNSDRESPPEGSRMTDQITGGDPGDDPGGDPGGGGGGYVFIGLFRLLDCELLREKTVVVTSVKHEFSSRHSLEWKFLFLDNRAPPIIGYLPFEVLGTSGYDYYHVDDLEKIASCHEALMQKGEGRQGIVSPLYRFLTKGQQWIWLQTRYFITYHQWNSKPDYIICTHRVVSYAEVMRELHGGPSSESSEVSGPLVPKQAKPVSRKSSKSLSSIKNSSSRTKSPHGTLNYGHMSSKRNCFGRKCSSTLTSSSAELTLTQSTQQQQQQQQIVSDTAQSDPTNPSSVSMCSDVFNTSISTSIHPQVPQYIQQQQQQQQQINDPSTSLRYNMSGVGGAMSMSLPNFNVDTVLRNPNFGLSNPSVYDHIDPVPFNLHQGGGAGGGGGGGGGDSVHSLSQVTLQDQLLMKHAELQAKIIRQQEELRRVSEQLLLTQFNQVNPSSSMQDDSQVLLPTPQHSPYLHPLQDQQQQQQQLMDDNVAHLHDHSNLFQYDSSIMDFTSTKNNNEI